MRQGRVQMESRKFMRLSGLKARAVIDKMKSVGVLRRRKQGR